MRVRTTFSLLVICSPVLFVIGFVACDTLGTTKKWVGQTDVLVRFIVTDAETCVAIPGVAIQIQDEADRIPHEPRLPQFTIKTDANGQAQRLATECMSFGSRGPFEDSFFVHLPFVSRRRGWLLGDGARLLGQSRTSAVCPSRRSSHNRHDSHSPAQAPVTIRRPAIAFSPPLRYDS